MHSEGIAGCIGSDLSFNNIEKIEGLSALDKLEDLILFNNRIEVIDNIDNLTRLQVLSVGNNAIQQLDTVCSIEFIYVNSGVARIW